MDKLRMGTIISVNVGPYEHLGILTDQGLDRHQTVISNSSRRGGVYEETIDVFTGGREMNVHGYIGSLDPNIAISRARSKIGSCYNIFHWNCEHFVRWAHGLVPESRQLKITFGIALLFLCGWAVLKVRK